MFKKILAATDLITVCDAAVISALRIAELNKGTLHIIHVLEPVSSEKRQFVRHYQTGKDIILTPDYIKAVEEEIRKTYSAELKSNQNHQIRVETCFKPDSAFRFPWEEIVQYSRELSADMIMLGPHAGKAQEKGVVSNHGKIGSTAEGVILREHCPILIVNRAIPAEKLKFKKIQVCIDFSKSCECALYYAIKIAKAYKSELTIFHMIPIVPYPKYTTEDYEADLKNIKHRLHQFCQEELPSGIPHEYNVWGGSMPHKEILKCADQTAADLIIMGSHTKEKTGKWYAGSAVERVSSRSGCPVMLVTDPEALIGWEEHLEAIFQERKDTERFVCIYTRKKNT